MGCQKLLTTLIGVLILTATRSVTAQTSVDSSRTFFRPLTLAPASAEATGGGGDDAAEEAAQNAELVKKTLNPIADLISVPVQNNWDFGIGPAEAMKFTANVQPVVPGDLVAL